MKHRADWVTPDHENGDRSNKAVPCAFVLPLSHYTRALEKPEERKPEESLCTIKWSARSRVRSPRTTKFFGHFFEARDNGDIVTCLLSLGEAQIIVIVAEML